MIRNLKLFIIFITCILCTTLISNRSSAVTFEDYNKSLQGSEKIRLNGISRGDGKDLEGYLYKPAGDGPYPALVALHGAGGIFPYQLWWAKEISKKGYVVLFVDHYCTRGLLCEVESGDSDMNRGSVMRNWQAVSPRQRVMDAVAAYRWLTSKRYIKKESIGLIGWSWGGSSALFAQKLARRLPLPNGGFKAAIAFYPNLKHVIDKPQWTRTGPIQRSTLILYGKADALESQEAYERLLSERHPGQITVVGFEGAYRKFDELGDFREKFHPSIGHFPKAFQKEAFEASLMEIDKFLSENLR